MVTKLKVVLHLTKCNVSYKTYPLYLKLSALSCLAITFIMSFTMYIVWPGLEQISYTLAFVSEIIGAIIILIVWFLWFLLAIASAGATYIHPILLRIANRFIYLLFPVTLGLGKVFIGIKKDELRQSMIDLINHLVGMKLYKVSPERILLLTPHCLQENTCIHKVTHDVYNCKQCGRCQVGGLLGIAKEYGCQFIVVTGGTLARMKVKEAKPKAIIAIACERDLASGMADVFPIPVIGVLNERPNGPCCNTTVDINKVREAVELLIDKDTYERNC
ncbi:DUF116 domain-containing protein [Veillonella sp.]